MGIPGFAGFLAQKYANQTTQVNAAANLTNTQADVLPGQAQAQEGFENAEAYKAGQEGQQVAPNSEALRGLQGAEAEKAKQEGYAVLPESMARQGLLGSQSDLNKLQLQPYSPAELRLLHHGVTDGFNNPLQVGPTGGGQGGDVPGYAKGTEQVPARGRGMVKMTPKGTDTVPAMLTPGEAVLNRHAAELMGRDKIAAANAIGDHIEKTSGGAPGGAPGHFANGTTDVPQPSVGVGGNTLQAPPGPGQTITSGTWGSPTPNQDLRAKMFGQSPRRYAEGTPNVTKPQDFSRGTHMVGHGKSEKTPSKIDPAAALALLSSLKGGGGMPPAGGGGGMPMPPGPPPGMPSQG